MLSILAAALHLGLVVGLRERLLLASEIRPGSVRGVVELRLLVRVQYGATGGAHLGPVVRRLQHDGAVAELLNKAILALDRFEESVCSSTSPGTSENLLA
jgi:hypothetical protein